MRHALVLVLAVLIMTPLAAGDQTHDIELRTGETFELDPYVFEYDRYSHGDGEQYLKIGERVDGTVWVIEQLTGDAIYDSIGDEINVSGDVSVRIQELGSDDGAYLDLAVTAPSGVFSSATIDSSAPDRVIASQGSSVDVPLTIENTGMTNQTFQLGSETSLEVTYGYQDFNVSEVFVRAGETVNLDATIDIPESAETGEHSVALVASNTTELSHDIVTEVRGQVMEPEMNFDVGQEYAGITPGEETRFSLSVRNMGEPALSGIEYDVTVPDGWEYELRPQGHDELERYDRGRSTLAVDAPADVQPGDHFIEVSAASERTSSETRRIRVNVSEKSRMGHIGLVLMGASFLVLIVVFLAFRRR